MKDIFEGAGIPLNEEGFNAALALIGGSQEALWSILQVETRGFGFFNDRRPKILYERHIFHARTGGRFDAKAPDLSDKEPGGYSTGTNEYSRLKRAMLLDRKAALESVSWGLGQVMGFNAVKIGYASVETMISAFAFNESAQIMGCVRFIAATPELKNAYLTHKWDRVALFYNGKKYAINAYDAKLATAYDDFVRGGCPSVVLRQVQAYLTYLGYNPKGIDGVAGSGTQNALAAFCMEYVPTSTGPQLPNANSPASAYLQSLHAAFIARTS